MAVDYRTNPAVFDKVVTILAQRQVRDEFNNSRSVWHPWAVVRASLEPLTGREYWQASQSQQVGSIRLVMRYRKGINDQMRFKYESNDGPIILEVKSPPINVLMQNQFLEIMCRELSDQKEI